ncbi:mitochondrial antiviral-signaling protein isoform X2 [Scomber japonicus]|uniref:mitochondrial antiviral-signaling protein isoform X2 n=1 Tax=Scomber japonicus TaxID=13676 RepID=UPI002306D91D|nr:mitochondrial antiviral-signaling protein isoform X2 [Scomber japonicus]
MSFASDKLYNGYLRKKMSTIVSTVKVREIMVHLPCLTAHDRETIEAKRETCGNFNGMVLLLECLKRRENWPEQFIQALEACEHTTIAAEIRAEYDSLRGVNNTNASPSPPNVVRAHVHPAPSASGPSAPGSDGDSQTAVAPPAAAAPPEPPAQAAASLETPAQPQAPQSPAAQVPKAAPQPEPVPEPPQSTEAAVAPAPSTPPPSPDTDHPQAAAPASPERELNTHQEPEENSESDIQNASDDRLQTTLTNAVRPPQSPSPSLNSDATDGSSYSTLTPEKPPVQDTMPPVVKAPATVLQPEEVSEPPTTQVIQNSPKRESTATTSNFPGAAGIDALIHDENSLCLSKPGQLMSVHPQNHANATISAPISPAEPYSGDSQRLQFSEPAPDTVTPAHIPACSAVNNMEAVSALPCEENGIALDHNEPEENQYDSPCQSLDMQDVQVNVGHVAEEPSILNLDGQSSTPQINGQAAKEINSAPPTTTADTVSSLNRPSGENYHPSAPVSADTAPEHKTLQDPEEKKAPCALPDNTKYILTAAGVGACALLMAWKFKN